MEAILNTKLPSGWRWAKLSDIATVINGTTPKSGVSEYWNGDIVWITPMDLGKLQDRYIHSSERCISKAGFESCNLTVVPKGSVVLSSRAPIGHLGIAAIELCTNQGCKSFIVGPDVDSHFLYFAIKNSIWELQQLGSGATFTEISKAKIENFEIHLPPLSEQKRIVKILNEQMAAVEKARKAVCDSFNTTNILSSAYLSNIFSQDNLKRWPKKPFGDIAQIIAKQVNPTLPEYRDLPHVNGENIESGTGRLTYLNTAGEELMISGKYLFPKGSVLYSKLRPYLRKVALVDFDGVCSADMYPIQVDSNYLRPDFTAWLLLSDEFTNYAVSESQRARMPKLNRKQLFSWEAPLPSLDEQKTLIDKLMLQMEKTTILNRKVEELVNTIEAFPSALLRKAFRGEM